MFSLIRWLFILRPKVPMSKETIHQNVWDMTHDEARQYYENCRKDPSALDRQRNGPRQLNVVRSTAPVCPVCGKSLGNRRPPYRRSCFKCKKCNSKIYAEPKQQLFESVYLTDKQKYLVDFLWQLDHWIFTAGTIHDFCWAKMQIGKTDAQISDDVVSDAIWFLLNYNLKNLTEINPGIDALSVKTYRAEIKMLIEEFRDAQKEWRGQNTNSSFYV
jgi:ribosomal protein L37AE/L43A